jgi:dihydroxy-acid dehydratase
MPCCKSETQNFNSSFACCSSGSCNNSNHTIGGYSNKNEELTKTRSKELTGIPSDKEYWLKRTAARAMMRTVGFKDQDFEKPLIAIAAPSAVGITPCNEKILDLAKIIQQEAHNSNLKAFYFGTPVVTDGEAMGASGMRYSLPSRDLIADCIEMMTEAYNVDGAITLNGCDKTIPGSLMPLARNNLVGITLYGGSTLPGNYQGRDLNIVSTFEAVGQYSAGKISYEDFMEVEKRAIPTCGACGGMYTANTMASGIEALGMSLPYSSSNPATNNFNQISESKYQDCILTVHALINLLQKNIKARDIMTRQAFENALTLVFAMGGSTNAVQHFLALAHEAEVDLTIDDYNTIAARVPLLADMKPSGKFLMYDVFKIGGVPMLLKHLYKNKLIHGDCLTVTGKTMSENLEKVPDLEDYLDLVASNQEKLFMKEKEKWAKTLFI